MPSCTWSIVAEPVSYNITSITRSDTDVFLESRHTMLDLIFPFIYFYYLLFSTSAFYLHCIKNNLFGATFSTYYFFSPDKTKSINLGFI